MHSYPVAGRENFPRQNSIETIAESVLRDKKNWTPVINLLKWSEVLQTEGFSFNSW